MKRDTTIDLLFEVREALEDPCTHPSCKGVSPLSPDLITRIVNHTNAYAQRSKLRSTGDAHRDRLVAARLDVYSS